MASGWVYNATPEVNEASKYPLILSVCISLTLLMMAVVALRWFIRIRLLRAVGSDDWAVIFSAVCCVVYNALVISQSRWGLGLPLALRPKGNTYVYRALNFAGRPFYMAGVTGFKVALCLAYLRIVGPHDRRTFKPLIWLVLVSCVVGHLAGTLVLIFQCTPVQKSLRPDTRGRCLPDDKTFYGLAAVTILYDCIIFLIPIPLLIRVRIDTARKVALIGLFVLGLFTTVCSVMRMVQIRTIAKNGNSTMLVLWGTIEMNVGIILTCIPSLAPLFRLFRGKEIRVEYSLPAYPARDDTTTIDNNNSGAAAPAPSHGTSQESILGINDILRTTDIEVTTTDARSAGRTPPAGSGPLSNDERW